MLRSTKQQLRDFFQKAIDEFKNPDSIEARRNAQKKERKLRKVKVSKKFGL